MHRTPHRRPRPRLRRRQRNASRRLRPRLLAGYRIDGGNHSRLIKEAIAYLESFFLRGEQRNIDNRPVIAVLCSLRGRLWLDDE
jgi:hypothetical protein